MSEPFTKLEVGKRYSTQELIAMGLLPELFPPEKIVTGSMIVMEVDHASGSITFESALEKDSTVNAR